MLYFIVMVLLWSQRMVYSSNKWLAKKGNRRLISIFAFRGGRSSQVNGTISVQSEIPMSLISNIHGGYNQPTNVIRKLAFRHYSAGKSYPQNLASDVSEQLDVANQNMDQNININSSDNKSNHKNNLIDGKEIAAKIRQELKRDISELKDAHHVIPGLAVILVGDRRDSATYVRNKKQACTQVGIDSYGYDYPVNVTQSELLSQIDLLNADPKIHGILVQLPLPPHIDEQEILNRVSSKKDVDGLHPFNVHKLAMTKTHHPGKVSLSFDSSDFHITCTPQGCIELLDRTGIVIAGKEVVVLGRSNIVGIPLALLLMQRDATVTIAHSRTQKLDSIISRADIVVAAVGRANFVKGEWLKEGAVVLDVGINSVPAPDTKKGILRLIK